MPPRNVFINPFILKAVIPDEFFCDRQSETDNLIELLKNGNNVVLKSERRVGKTALLHHMLGDKRVAGVYDTYFVDIFNTENERQFAGRLATALFKGNVSVPFREKLLALLGRFRIDLSPDLLTGFVKPSVSFDGAAVPDYRGGIESMFDLLEKTGRPAIVVFDEFQQIEDYPEKRLSATLRTRIQNLNHVGFVFSGSERRLLDHIFNTSTEPFYRSCTDMELRKIQKDVYVDFTSRMFGKYGKSVDKESVSDLYDLLYGYTSYLNTVLNHSFMRTRERGFCGSETILDSLSDCISGKDLDFHNTYFGLSSQSRSFLKGLAVRRGSSSITSAAFLESCSLTASQAQTAAWTLVGRGLKDRHVVKDPRTGVFSIDNRFFEIWIRNMMGQSLGSQLSQASDFVREDPRDGLRKDFPSVSFFSKEEAGTYDKYGRLLQPFVTESIDRKITGYLVQKGPDGKPWSLPVEDCMALMEGILSLPVRKGENHPLSEEEKKVLAGGGILEIGNKLFQFDLPSMMVRRRYRTKSRSKTPGFGSGDQ